MVQCKGYCLQCFFAAFRYQFALPYRDTVPTHFCQFTLFCHITLLVPANFSNPELTVSIGYSTTFGTFDSGDEQLGVVQQPTRSRITVKNDSAVADMVIFLPNGMSGFVSTRNQFIQPEKNGKVKDVIVNICGRNGKDYYVKTFTVSSTGASSVNSKDSYGQATPPSECQ